MKDLQLWLERVKEAVDGKEIFQILDEFRPGDWTDEERASMSKIYIAALGKFESPPNHSAAAETKTKKAEATPETKPAAQEAPPKLEELIDEEVWYEKM